MMSELILFLQVDESDSKAGQNEFEEEKVRYETVFLYYGHRIWASLRENLSSVVCEQQMRRPACTYAQSDQRLCYSLIVKYHI